MNCNFNACYRLCCLSLYFSMKRQIIEVSAVLIVLGFEFSKTVIAYTVFWVVSFIAKACHRIRCMSMTCRTYIENHCFAKPFLALITDNDFFALRRLLCVFFGLYRVIANDAMPRMAMNNNKPAACDDQARVAMPTMQPMKRLGMAMMGRCGIDASCFVGRRL